MDCPADYYNSNGVCYKCPVGCSSCSSGKNCTTCDTGLSLFSNSTHRTCECANGKYGVPNYSTDTLTCLNCNSNCQSCNYTATNCTSCATPNFLYSGTCVSNCAIQSIPSYNNATDRKCYKCGTNCEACLSSTKCITCINNDTFTSYNHNGICKTTCPDDTLTNSVSKICEDCAANCAHCTGTTTNCDLCNSGYYLESATCISDCPKGKFPDTTSVC